ncbi:MAG: guanylate kinase [Clostridia bacterium]|nr:guanylate kinase [Clostridia bacterium]MBR6741954.1 guanylate kinase [Clostridia bacterium]
MQSGFFGNKKGLLFVVSGPAGSGKGTIMKMLMEKSGDYSLSVSATSRAPGKNETNGVEYYFKTREEFEEMIKNGELLEYTEYVGNYYGTPKAPALEMLNTGKHLLLEIDVTGGLNIKREYPDAILVMIVPPGAAEQERRLRDRGRDSEESILRRLERAKEELSLIDKYDYILVNETGKAEDTVQAMLDITAAELSSVHRTPDVYTKFFGE